MSTSTAQMAANRRNALKSTGPKTPAGKAKSARNALRHGLCSPRFVLVQDEQPEELREFHDRLYECLAPSTPFEEMLVERVISQAWRLRRVIRIERDVLTVGQIEA